MIDIIYMYINIIIYYIIQCIDYSDMYTQLAVLIVRADNENACIYTSLTFVRH